MVCLYSILTWIENEEQIIKNYINNNKMVGAVLGCDILPTCRYSSDYTENYQKYL